MKSDRLANAGDCETTEYADMSVGAKLAEGIGDRLKYDFVSLFTEVRQDAPLARPNELVVTGTTTKYEPGSKFARAMLAGLGTASLKGELILKQADNEKVVMTAPFDKLLAWGGTLGASKSMDEMLTEVASASAAATMARSKGLEPKK